MTTVAVTGASGFLGRHVVDALRNRGVTIIATSREPRDRKTPGVEWRHMDLDAPPEDPWTALHRPDHLIHLAWEGLPNYKSRHHFETELPRQYRYLSAAIRAGLPSLFVAGTCFEYGMRSGPLAEDIVPDPANPYALAKDGLRRRLGFLKDDHDFRMLWGRLFYVYGEGQRGHSLWAQFQAARRDGRDSFDMSGGHQLRDFLPAEEVAERIVTLVLDRASDGVVNICSGQPVTIEAMVRSWAAEMGWNGRINLGRFPYPDWEPFEFWGDATRLSAILGHRS